MITKPWLYLPAKWAHDLSPLFLPLYSTLHGSRTPAWQSFVWRDLLFRNPLGIAGGVDKNAENLKSWWRLGCGFVEIGTVTPLPQEANPGKILDRCAVHEALWNKMGFPSHGAREVFHNLNFYAPYFRTPIFVNIGKNRTTANHEAVKDYLHLINEFKPLADVFVVNISSPNTQGLRELQKRENLDRLLSPLIERTNAFEPTPILVKLSPDMEPEALAQTISTCDQLGIDGYILTNTTLSRQPAMKFSPSEGGVSGRPLADLSKQALKIAVESLGSRRKDKLLVSVGGIMTPDDALERLKMGADLVQIYTALIFYGPKFFQDCYLRTKD